MLHFLKILGAEGDFLSLQCREGDVQIDLKECAKNAARELGFPDTHCAADRDVTAFEFIFYTEPKTILRVRRRNFQRGYRIALPRKIKAVRARARANIQNSITGAQITFNIANGR